MCGCAPPYRTYCCADIRSANNVWSLQAGGAGAIQTSVDCNDYTVKDAIDIDNNIVMINNDKHQQTTKQHYKEIVSHYILTNYASL